jgi:hypothetical protein
MSTETATAAIEALLASLKSTLFNETNVNGADISAPPDIALSTIPHETRRMPGDCVPDHRTLRRYLKCV